MLRFQQKTFRLLVFFLLLWITHPVPGQDSCFVALDKKDNKLFEEGVQSFQRGAYHAAANAMLQLVRKYPDLADGYYILGVSYTKRRNSDFTKAKSYFNKVIEVCPKYSPYVHYYLGEIAYSNEDYEATIRHLDLFLEDVDQIKSDADYDRAVQLLDYSRFYKEMLANPVPFNPQLVEGISTIENEYLAILSPDNQLAMFTREKKILPDKNSLVQRSGYQEKFMYSMRDFQGAFPEGTEMPEPFNIYDNEGGATLTADNNTLYYTVCQKDEQSGYLNCDIWFSTYTYGFWSEIKNAGARINRADSWESQPSISSDGKTIYFVSDRKGGYGGYDIYRAMKAEDGSWGAVVNLGPMINTSGNEKSPFIHADGKTLYFSSDGWMGLGGYDIFMTKRQEDRLFSKPKNLGYPINSTGDEVGFFVSTDGTTGFFGSNKIRETGGWDLYAFDLYDKVRPEKVLFIKGTIKDESSFEPVKARVELKNVETKKVNEVPVDSNTGNYVAIAPFTTDYVMTIKKEGYVYESKYIAKTDTQFQKPAQVDMEVKPIELYKSYKINDIYFEFNSYTLTPESMVVLDQLIEFLELNTLLSIEIRGHTDAIGNDADNLVLSENRAKSVYDYLISNNIPSNRLTYKGYGESMPVATNDTEEGRAKNRRTCFVITSR
jgi:outer membrane protein OmpA-like peptidoglycan-associated protein/tetratricopeptide (TPR) repeat protein